MNDGGILRFEGANSADLADQPAGIMLPMLARMLNQQGLASRSDPFILVQTMRDRIAARENVKVPSVGPADHFASLVELLDGIILLYHSAAHKQLFKVYSIINITYYTCINHMLVNGVYVTHTHTCLLYTSRCV